MKVTKDYLKRLIKEELQEVTKISKTMQLKIGDPVLIGMEGTRKKYYTFVKDIRSNGEIVDSKGNIYEPSGRLKRRSNKERYQFGYLTGRDPGNKNVQMQIYDVDDYTEDFRDSLKGYIEHFLREKFDDLSIDVLKELAKTFKVQIGEKKYKEDI